MLSNSWKRESAVLICANCNSVFNVKELEGAFNQEKALVGAFSFTKVRLKLYNKPMMAEK